jgi:hypothetical protein
MGNCIYYEEMESSTIKEKNNNLALNITAEIAQPIEKIDNKVQQIEKLDDTNNNNIINKSDDTNNIREVYPDQLIEIDIIESYNIIIN